MQTAGQKCSSCSRKIVLDAEGAACASCGAVAHRECVAGSASTCAQCGAAWVDSRTKVAHASRCPACGMDSRAPAEASCRSCGALLVFDSPEEFERDRRRVHLAGWRQLAASLAMILLAGLCCFAAVDCARQRMSFPDKSRAIRSWMGVPVYSVVGVLALIGGLDRLYRARTSLRYK